MICKPALFTCLLLWAAMAAMGQSMMENQDKCQSVDPDTRIVGCSALIQVRLIISKEKLSVIYNNRGSAYNSKHDYDRAIQDFTEAIRLTPNTATTYRERGIAYSGKGDFDRAIQDYDQAIRLNSNDTSVYVVRGDAYRGKRDYDRAIQDFNEAIRLSPNYARAYYDRGQAYDSKDDYDRAIQDYDQAINLNPKVASAYYSRGSAYYNKSDYDHAIQNLDQAIRLNPNFALFYEKRGDAYSAQSKLTPAIADFERAISIDPSSRTAVYAALMLHVAMKRQGHTDAQELATVAASADLSQWPGPLLKLDLGQMSAEQVMMAAASPGSDIQKWQVCEANYFTGEDALLHHQQATALARLKVARDGCPKDDTEYAATLAELKRLGAPAVPAR